MQVTAASLEGARDRAAQAAALRLLELGLVHVLASDSHGPHIRREGLGAVARGLGGPGAGALSDRRGARRDPRRRARSGIAVRSGLAPESPACER